jgi:NAD(P)-dependent dehydrogenase (short-subunit alcohol dehydrogenase family)
VFEDGSPLAQRFVARLAATGRRITSVRPGTRYEAVSAGVWTINPDSRGDYVSLLNALNAGQRMPARIVHLWGLTGTSASIGDDRAVLDAQRRGFYSLISLAQAIGDVGLTSKLALAVVTDGVHEVTGDELVAAEKATVIGPCRVIPQEYTNIACTHLDLAMDEVATLRDDHLDSMVGDLLSHSRDVDVAYRHGRRWTLGYAGVRLEAPAETSRPRLRDGGTYLITGGFGGIGLVLAEHLAETCHARLVLTGRHGVPPREEWPARKASADARTKARIDAMERLERLGATVLCAEADVADFERMREVVALAQARFGRIDGVIHAAGIAGGGVIQLKKPEVAAAVLTPKVGGARVLGRLFQGQKLDFMILCSSLTSIYGGIGQVDYCGANAYLDAFARQFGQATGTFTVSVNWNAWRDVGMAVDTDVPDDLRDAMKGSRAATGIGNREGIDVFRRILAGCSERQVAISPADLRLQFEAAALPDDAVESRTMARAGSAPGRTQASGAASTPAHARPSLQNAYVAPRTDTERAICVIWQDFLGIDRIGINDNFFELGGHSLLAIRVMGRVNETLRSDLAVAKLYEGLTVAFLGELVEPAGRVEADRGDDAALAERRREKARRQKEQQQRRRVVMGR